MTLENFLSLLEGVKKCSGNTYTALCPAHADNKPSLSVSTGSDGRILVNCHAGCSPQEVVNALGLEMKDLYPEKEKKQARKLVARYEYTDENGNLLSVKTRWEPKSFTWSYKENGEWKSGRNGDPVLYNLYGIKDSETVYLVEGEKDVETLRSIGLAATSPPDGANGTWKKTIYRSTASKECYYS